MERRKVLSKRDNFPELRDLKVSRMMSPSPCVNTYTECLPVSIDADTLIRNKHRKSNRMRRQGEYAPNEKTR